MNTVPKSSSLRNAVDSYSNTWNQQSSTSASNSLFLIPSINEHVSLLDPKMSSVAQYSPESSYNNNEANIVSSKARVSEQVTAATHTLPTLDKSVFSFCKTEVNSSNCTIVEDDCHLSKDVNVTLDLVNITDNCENGSGEQEVEIVLAGQTTGILYSVSAQEYFINKLLDEQVLDILTFSPTLDTDFLTIGDSTVKCEIKDTDFNKTSSLNTTFNGSEFNETVYEVKNSLNNNENDVNFYQDEENKAELSKVRIINSTNNLFVIKTNKNRDFGVFAKKIIPKKTQFGPLEGKIFPVNNSNCKNEEELHLFIKEEESMFKFDLSYENSTNWMCFVKKAKNIDEQNLVVIQKGSSLFYTSTKQIQPKQELLVDYSLSYAAKYNLSTLLSHVENAIEWPCFECGDSFSSYIEFKSHNLLHNQEKCDKYQSFECKICHEMFTTSKLNVFLTHLQQHQEIQLNEKEMKIFICDECKMMFVNSELLIIHQLFHKESLKLAGNKMSLQCPSCWKKFRELNHLICHVNFHAVAITKEANKCPINKFNCPMCYKSFSSPERLQKHMLVHGSEESKPLKCDVCSKRFLNNSALACHVKTHSNKYMFECPMCEEKFRHVRQLKSHVSKHKSDGKYTCPKCDKVFKEYCVIRKHIRAFHCEKKHACSHCPKMFPTVDKLKMHLLKHSDHKEFLCSDCGKQFKRKDKLNEHAKRMHSVEERGDLELKVTSTTSSNKFNPKVALDHYHQYIYKCHTCVVGFKRRGMLVNHLAKRHPDVNLDAVPELNLPILRTTRNYFCQFCDKVYKSSSKRKAHVIKNHPGQQMSISNEKLGRSSGAVDNSRAFTQTVGSVASKPQYCQWCHKQYASKAKLLQHQRKKHPQLVNSVENESKLIEGRVEGNSDGIFSLGKDNKCKVQFYQVISLPDSDNNKNNQI